MKLLPLILASVLTAGRLPAQWGGELKLSLHSEPKTLHPALVEDDASETVVYLTAGTLVRVNRVTEQVEPALAVSWKVQDSGKAIRFRLRENVCFSDKTPFAADDVVFTIETLFDPKLHSPVADAFHTGSGTVTATASGANEVTIRFSQPLAGGVRLFDQVAILSRHSPPGSGPGAVLGPFRIAERKPGVYIRLERNPHYWKMQAGRRLPYLDWVRLEIQQNRDAELLRFRRGELHLLSSLDAEQFDQLSHEKPGWVQDAGPALDNEFLWFNQAPSAPLADHVKAWFTSRNFRLAVSHAIQRDDLCRVVYRGRAKPGIGPFPASNLLWFNKRLKPHSFDVAEARRLLALDGFREEGGTLRDRSGQPVEFSIITNAGNKVRERMAAMIQQDLAHIGIRLNVVALDFPSLLERIGKTGRYEACLLGLSNVDMDPDGQMNFWLSSSTNHPWYPREPAPATPWEVEIDRLLLAQASSADASRRKALFDRVQEIVSEQAPVVFLVNPDALVAVSPSVGNARPAILYPRVLWNVDEIYLKPNP